MTINEEVVKILTEKDLTVASAESCTGGLLAKLITDVPGSSSVFGYGIVSYANEIKWGQLGVKRETVETYGAVSEETAREMCECARKNGGSDIGIATTGIAGPDGGTPSKPNGTCFIGFADKDKTVVEKISTGISDRAENRKLFAQRAFEIIKENII